MMEPIKDGMLANLRPELEDMLKILRLDFSIVLWVLRSVGSLDGVMIILSGMSNGKQMEDNLHTFSKFEILSDKEEQVIKIVVRKMQDVFRALNTIRMYPGDNSLYMFYKRLPSESGRASTRIACGQCEYVCS